MTICNIVCACIVLFFVSLRLYTRTRIVNYMGPDDYILLFALAIWFTDMSLFQVLTQWGMGKHLWDVSQAILSPGFLRLWVIAAIVYSGAILFIKLSILFFYRHLFPVDQFSLKWWLVTIFTVGYSVGGICASLFACTPMRASWDMNIKEYHCIDKSAFYIVNAVLNSFSDLLILALPLPVVWKLGLDTRQKITLSIVFTLGSLSCIISIVRLKAIILYMRHADRDITYDLQEICLWSEIETTVCMVCACVPTLRPFMRRHFGFFASMDSGPSSTPNKRDPLDKTVGRDNHNRKFFSANMYAKSRARGEDLELRFQKNAGEAIVTVSDSRDYDAESTDRIIDVERGSSECEDERECRENPFGIKVQQSYQVSSSLAR
ncbi:uncharacterized protein K452DRAFT_286486 [Aplosporella prunicola CBS 121167]|uniref:Rhodopsin domain-containing protein n=1 Tax=Aplosporella prunicola CBS 121167 TaxID=1176127 RepID=A0A6A6BFB4_9PEZI|nr:uncharacterized protein K452DRAFT_286486 [Aplosporella prunicola CBS 121167]KAF2142859.1 hypothetical protein K452DRAFT_286486 [Aplosporella prunicola CBS 121167]